GPEPALVVATRGAEPIAAGGYRAVLLLDGERMLLRESLRVAEDCLRWWSNAAALAAPGATVHPARVGGDRARGAPRTAVPTRGQGGERDGGACIGGQSGGVGVRPRRGGRAGA